MQFRQKRVFPEESSSQLCPTQRTETWIGNTVVVWTKDIIKKKISKENNSPCEESRPNKLY